jgi:DNA end-binding protein Ku
MPRAIASATVSFGLVSIPVNLYAATETGAEIRFHWLHKDCGARVKQQYYCPKHDEVVSRKDLVKGYEFAKNRYVTFTPEELQALDAESTQVIEITEFVPIEKIDPIYFEHPYHLGPGKGGQHAFAMLGKAMAQMDRAALGKYAARGKEYLVMVRPFADGLVMQQLHYADEIHPAVAMNGGKVKESELKLAKQLIEQISSNEFKPDAYEDEVRERVREQIQRKVKGEAITAQPTEVPKGKVVDLMEALKASLSKQGAKGNRRTPSRAARRRAPPAPCETLIGRLTG